MKDDLKERLARLEAEHAATWRAITMSNEWRKLQTIEGKIELLRELTEASQPDQTIDMKNSE